MFHSTLISFWAKHGPAIPSLLIRTVTPDELTLLHFLFITIAGLGIFMGCYLIAFKKGHNVFMGIHVLAMAFILLELTLLWWDGNMHIPKIPFMSSLLFVLGPSLTLYLEHKIFTHRKLKTQMALLFFSIFFLSFFLLLLVTNSENGETTRSFKNGVALFLDSSTIKSIYSLFFLGLMVRSYTRYRFQLEVLDRKWSGLLISFFIVLTLLSLARTFFEDELGMDNIARFILAYFCSVFILMLSILLYFMPQLVTAPISKRIELFKPREKYQNSGLTSAMSHSLKQQLLVAMEQKVYLDPTISLESLAKKLNTDRYSLSQVINQEFNSNFYEFINDHRIGECMAMIHNNPVQPDSIADLIYNSGFNNKVSFYKAFKKKNKMTPAQYIKSLGGN
jgi:AraC-like DNA-binding protein